MQCYNAIGLMSGTSMDGVDAVLIRTNGQYDVERLAYQHIPYDKATHHWLKIAEFALHQAQGDMALANQNFEGFALQYTGRLLHASQPQDFINTLRETLPIQSLQQLIAHSTELHVKATKTLLGSGYQPDIIGYHGQTLYHEPTQACSIQIGDANALASEFNIPVVSQFRQNDLKHGGQGAPIAPIYHQALLARDHQLPAVVVNCGGIANVSLIPDEKPQNMIGFDCGPGNVLLDRFVRLRTEGAEQMDKDGRHSLKGQIIDSVQQALYKKSCTISQFYTAPAPKSLDSFDLQLPTELETLSLEDGCANLAYFTANTIVNSVTSYCEPSTPYKWILAGGGWYNPAMTDFLRELIPAQTSCHHASDIGWSNQSLEAELIAYAAVRCQQHLPLTFPNTTGCKTAQNGGIITTQRTAIST